MDTYDFARDAVLYRPRDEAPGQLASKGPFAATRGSSPQLPGYPGRVSNPTGLLNSRGYVIELLEIVRQGFRRAAFRLPRQKQQVLWLFLPLLLVELTALEAERWSLDRHGDLDH